MPSPTSGSANSGPRFLSDGRRLAVADFAWNVYGYPRELLVGSYNLLRRGIVAKDLAARLDLPVVSTAVVAEGGALDVSDAVILAYKGTALQRNPGGAARGDRARVPPGLSEEEDRLARSVAP